MRGGPSDEVEARVELLAPRERGNYRVYFRLVRAGTLSGVGDRLWADFVVQDGD